MSESKFELLIKKALVLNTEERTIFLEQIEDDEDKQKIAFLLNDDTELTAFLIKTSAGTKPLESHKIKDLAAGDKIKQFLIKKLIAKGGMGSVYLAYDEKLKRNVAVKTIRSEYLNSQSSQKRFEKEAQILSQINHPSICQIYDYIDYDDGDLLVLELVKGETLSKIELTGEQKLDVFIQIASALVAAHDKGVIHRDLKPDNIMLSDEGKIKILDFGIAKSKQEEIKAPKMTKQNADDNNINDNSEQHLTKVGSLMGTLVYMSPEQASAQEVTKASDIYSLAVIMQEILTGISAYHFEDTKDLQKQVINAQLVDSELLPENYHQLIASMSEKDFYNRPTACDIQQQLLLIKEQPKILKRKRRNQLFTFIGFCFVILVLLQWYNFNQNKKKSIFINEIKGNITDVAETLQKIYTLPLHDITTGKSKLELSINKLVLKLDSSPILSNPEKSFYKGKLYIDQKNIEEAFIELNKAWDGGFQTEESALELASVYSFKFYKELQVHIENPAYFKTEAYEILKNTYLQPAKFFLERNNNSKIKNISNAIILWGDNQTQKAILMLDDIISSQDWLFEAYTLKAYFLNRMAYDFIYQGKEIQATELYNQAIMVYQDANIRGRSYPNAYGGICEMNFLLVVDSGERTGVDITDNYHQGLKACKNMLKLKPETTLLYDYISSLHYYYAHSLIQKGEQAMEYLDKALDWNSKSLEIEQYYEYYDSKSNIYVLKAQLKLESGLDPTADIEQSIKANLESIKLRKIKKYQSYSSIIYALLVKMEHQISIGQSTLDSFNQAKSYFDLGFADKTITVYGKKYLYVNMAEVSNAHARYQILNGDNPQSTIDFTKQIISQEQKEIDDEPYGFSTLANADLILSQYIRNKGGDASESLKLALQNIDKANTIFEDNAQFLSIKASILKEIEINKIKRGTNYKPNFNLSLEQFDLTLKAKPNSPDTLTKISNILLLQAKYFESKKAKVKAINKGIESCKNALEINSNYAQAYFNQAKLINYGIEIDMFSDSERSQVQKLFEKAQSINPLLKL